MCVILMGYLNIQMFYFSLSTFKYFVSDPRPSIQFISVFVIFKLIIKPNTLPTTITCNFKAQTLVNLYIFIHQIYDKLINEQENYGPRQTFFFNTKVLK